MLVWEEEDTNCNGVELALEVLEAPVVVVPAVAVATTPPAEEAGAAGAGVGVPITKAAEVAPATVAVEKAT